MLVCELRQISTRLKRLKDRFEPFLARCFEACRPWRTLRFTLCMIVKCALWRHSFSLCLCFVLHRWELDAIIVNTSSHPTFLILNTLNFGTDFEAFDIPWARIRMFASQFGDHASLLSWSMIALTSLPMYCFRLFVLLVQLLYGEKGRTLKSIWGSIVIPSATSFTRVAFVLNLVFVLNFPSIFFRIILPGRRGDKWICWCKISSFLVFVPLSQDNRLVQSWSSALHSGAFSTSFGEVFHVVLSHLEVRLLVSFVSIAECGLPSLFWVSLAIRLDLMKRIAIMGDGSTLFLPEWPRISTHVKKVTVVGVYAILKYVLIASFLSTWFSHVCFVHFLFFKEVGIKHKKQISPLNSKWQFGQHWPTAPMSRNPILHQLWRNAQRHPQLHANARDVHRKLS